MKGYLLGSSSLKAGTEVPASLRGKLGLKFQPHFKSEAGTSVPARIVFPLRVKSEVGTSVPA